MKTALFPGSFDPVTLGHQDLILRSARLFDRVVVAVGHNTQKRYAYPVEQRVEWLRRVFAQHPNIEVRSYSCLTIDLCRQLGIGYIVRGIRNEADFRYESDIAAANRMLCPDVETLYLPCSPACASISSSLVRELMSFGHSVEDLLPEAIRPDFAR